MKLVIVESPTKAKTLSKYLGKEYEISASMGHIRDLPKSGLGVDIEKGFKPEYEVPSKAKKTLSTLKKLANGAEKIILATDPDREGEAIAWHLKELLSSKTKKKTSEDNFQRVVFHELTDEAIREAFNKPGKIDMFLVDAQQARRILDRLVGYKLSPLLWKKVMYGLSAGRVQSVAVRLIVERERERKDFKPEEYWSIEGLFSSQSGVKKTLIAELVKDPSGDLKIISQQQAKNLENELYNDSFSVSDVKKSERTRNPGPPLKTSTLQQAASNIFGFTAKKTMVSAQCLFEKGYITYHRTDSLNLSPQFISSVRSYVKKELGEKYLPDKGIFYKTTSKNAQEAHEAIRPTNVFAFPTSLKLPSDEQKIYALVWKRAVESQMLPAVYDQTTISVGSKKGYVFKAVGSAIKFYGWLILGEKLGITADFSDVKEIANFEVGGGINLEKLTSEQHFTQPPARYSDASLIKKLEELGVGRPSTYAPTISTIQSRGYIEKEGKYFVPRDVAFVVVDLLTEHFGDIVDYKFTADMEEELDDIACGKREWIPVIKDFYTPFEKNLLKKEAELKKTDVTTLEETDEKCPDCGKNLVVKLGKFGKFLSCLGYPECKYARPMNEDIALDDEGKEITDFGKCTSCEDGIFVLKKGRFGRFLACSNYPKCKTTKPYLEKIGVPCPKCEEGDVVVKKARGRIFYGCSRYPECDYSSWKKPGGGERV